MPRFFGMKRKKVYAFPIIKAIWKTEKKDIELFTSQGKKDKFTFLTQRECNDAFDLAESLWVSFNTNLDPDNNSEVLSQRKLLHKQSFDEDDDNNDPEMLSKEDWEFLLQGAKTEDFKMNEVIVSEGEDVQRIYQIIEGTCRIEKGTDQPKVLGKMDPGSTFGEISFLLSGGASASVLADSDNVQVYIMEGYFINILFSMKAEMAGRFYKYLATLLQRRVRVREEGK